MADDSEQLSRISPGLKRALLIGFWVSLGLGGIILVLWLLFRPVEAPPPVPPNVLELEPDEQVPVGGLNGAEDEL